MSSCELLPAQFCIDASIGGTTQMLGLFFFSFFTLSNYEIFALNL